MIDETKAETILKMIEEVDPNDTAKLDEIDARMHIFFWPSHLHPAPSVDQLIKAHYDDIMGGWEDSEGNERLTKVFELTLYTRSRDALKAIRPKGWWIRDCERLSDFVAGSEGRNYYIALRCQTENKIKTVHAYAISEELAELQAIIQAIEYERRSAATSP